MMRRTLFALACVLLWSGTADAATVALGVVLNSTANSPASGAYTTGSFTAAVGDRLVVMCSATGAGATPTYSISDSLGGQTYTEVKVLSLGTPAAEIHVYVSDGMASGSARTITCAVNAASPSSTGANVVVWMVTGVTRNGAALVRGDGSHNLVGGNTPAPALPAAALTGNPTIGFVLNSSNPATLTEPTGWTELNDSAYTTPTYGVEAISRDSGFTGTTVTWGSTSATQFMAYIMEIDTSAPSSGGSKKRGLLLGVGQ